MWLVALLIGAIAAGETVEPVAPPSLDETVAQAVRSFERPWMPEDKELAGLVIGIDAEGGAATEPDARRWDDLNLLTAEYLYHMVRRSGATPVMTRTDDRPFPGDLQARMPLLHGYGCRVCVTIRYEQRPADDIMDLIVLAEHPMSDISSMSLRTYIDRAIHEQEMPAGRLGRRPPAVKFPAACEVRFRVGEGEPAMNTEPAILARANAAKLIRAIASFCRTEGVVPRPPDSPEATAFARLSTAQDKLRTLARSIWPEGDLPQKHVDWFCRSFARTALTNRTLTYFKSTATVEDDVIVLRGATDTPSLIDGLTAAFAGVGIDKVRSEMRVLPEQGKLGGQLFGVCQAPMAVSYIEPSPYSGPQTQLLFGEPVFLLDLDQGHYLLHGGDGYWGWVREDSIRPMNQAQFQQYTNQPRATVLQDIVTGGIRIPRGAHVAIDGSPAGESLSIVHPNGKLLPINPLTVRMSYATTDKAAEERVRTALDLLYTPYLFGGRSSLGIDCSGLVVSACTRTGMNPARDAWQQALAGTLSATRWSREGLRAGDIVFFIQPGGKVYHTGIAISSTHIIDGSPPAVQIGSIRPGDRLYDKRMDRDFFMAKRP